MALSVYKVDKKTRLVMPDSRWGYDIITKLEGMGHEVELTTEDAHDVQNSRPADELKTAMELIDSTGL